MRKVTVPIDMSSEQKVILGFISKRQLLYMFLGGGLIYSYVPFIFNLFTNFIMGGIAALIAAVPTVVLIILLSFWKMDKYSLYFDRYILVKLGYKHQIGVWRKGSKE